MNIISPFFKEDDIEGAINRVIEEAIKAWKKVNYNYL